MPLDLKNTLDMKLQAASYRILQAITPRKQGLYVMYVSAALAIASIADPSALPAPLAAIATGLGVEALGTLLSRLTDGKELSEEDIVSAVEQALPTANLNSIQVKSQELVAQVTGLVSWQQQIMYLVEQDRDLANNILHQYGELSADVFAIRETLQTVATQEQSEDIKAMIQQVIDLLISQQPKLPAQPNYSSDAGEVEDRLIVLNEYRQQLMVQTEFADFLDIPLPEDRFGRVLTPRIPLETIYVQVKALPEGSTLSKAREEQQQVEANVGAGYEAMEVLREKLVESNDASEDLERLEAIDPQIALKEHRRIVVLGDPGAGKTTMLRFIARTVAQTDLDTVPIYVEVQRYLIRLSQDDSVSLARFAIEQAAGSNLELQHLLWRMAGSSQILWLVDGLDDARERRDHVLEQCGMLRGDLVLTSRVSGYKKGGLVATLPHYELLPLSSENIEHFSRNWLRAAAGSDDNQISLADAQIELMQERLRKQPRLRDLAHNPLLLTFLVVLAANDSSGQLPEHRAELYRQYIEELLDSWETAKEIPDPHTQKRKLSIGPWSGAGARDMALSGFCHLGWFLHSAYYGAMSELPPDLSVEVATNELATHFSKQHEELDHLAAREVANDVVDFWQRAGMLEIWTLRTYSKRAPQRFLAFRHMTFQEYAAGRVLADAWRLDEERAWGEILQRTHQHAWNEPLLLFAGLLNQAERDKLLERLLKYDQADNWALPYSVYARSEKARCKAVRSYLRRELMIAASIISDNYKQVSEQHVQAAAARLSVLMRSNIPTLARAAAQIAANTNDWYEKGPFSLALVNDIEQGYWDNAPSEGNFWGLPSSVEVLYQRMSVDPLPIGLVDMLQESLIRSTKGWQWKILLLTQVQAPESDLVEILLQAYRSVESDKIKLRIAQSMARSGRLNEDMTNVLLEDVWQRYGPTEMETLHALKQTLQQATFPVESVARAAEGLIRITMGGDWENAAVREVLLAMISPEQGVYEVARSGATVLSGVEEPEDQHLVDHAAWTLGELMRENNVHEAVFDVLRDGVVAGDSEAEGESPEKRYQIRHRIFNRVLYGAVKADKPDSRIVDILLEALSVPRWDAEAAAMLAQIAVAGGITQDQVATLDGLWKLAYRDLVEQIDGVPTLPITNYQAPRISNSAATIFASLVDQELLGATPAILEGAAPRLQKAWRDLLNGEIVWGIREGFFTNLPRRLVESIPHSEGVAKSNMIYMLSLAIECGSAPAESVEIILDALDDDDPAIRMPSLRGLVYLIANELVGPEHGLMIVDEFLSENREVRFRAKENLSVLARSGHVTASMVQALVQIALDFDHRDHNDLMRVLGNLLESGCGSAESFELLKSSYDNVSHALERLGSEGESDKEKLDEQRWETAFMLLRAARGGWIDSESAKMLYASAKQYQDTRPLIAVEAFGFAMDADVTDTEVISFLQETFNHYGSGREELGQQAISALCRACEIPSLRSHALSALVTAIERANSWIEKESLVKATSATALSAEEVKIAALYLLERDPKNDAAAAFLGRVGKYQAFTPKEVKHFLDLLFENDTAPLSWEGRIRGLGFLLENKNAASEAESLAIEALLEFVSRFWYMEFDNLQDALRDAFASAELIPMELLDDLALVLNHRMENKQQHYIAIYAIAAWANANPQKSRRLVDGLIKTLESADYRIPYVAGELLGYFDHPEIPRALLQTLGVAVEEELFERAQRGAAVGLGHVGRRQEQHQQQILRLFQDVIKVCEKASDDYGPSRLRSAVLEATGNMRSHRKEAHTILGQALRYPHSGRYRGWADASDRQSVAVSAAVGGYASPEVIAALLKLLESQDPRTRDVAWLSLRELADAKDIC